MSELSCVPALILLNGALHHYGLKMIYFHPKKEHDDLLALNQRAYMSRTIRMHIPEARKEELELSFAKAGRKRIGYDRLQVLDTTHKHGRDVANRYIQWYNDKKFAISAKLVDVLESEITDTSSIREIGLKYKHLRPKTNLPLDEGSEPEVEDESPMSNNTEKESDDEESPTEGEEDLNKKPSADDQRSPSDGKEAAATSKDSDTDLPEEPEESEDEEAKLPSRQEARADDTAATGKGPSRTLFGDILDRGAAALSGATKKRKNVAPAKPAPKSKKASTRPPSRPRKPTKDVPANEPQAPDEGAEANAVTPAGHA